jgi:hypothetical protein
MNHQTQLFVSWNLLQTVMSDSSFKVETTGLCIDMERKWIWKIYQSTKTDLSISFMVVLGLFFLWVNIHNALYE